MSLTKGFLLILAFNVAMVIILRPFLAANDPENKDEL
jgi:hypothetical protein